MVLLIMNDNMLYVHKLEIKNYDSYTQLYKISSVLTGYRQHYLQSTIKYVHTIIK